MARVVCDVFGRGSVQVVRISENFEDGLFESMWL